MQPKRRYGERRDVPSRSGRSRSSAYDATGPARKRSAASEAASSPGGGRSGASGPEPMSVGASSEGADRHGTPTGRPSGGGQPWSSQARRNGVNTRYGAPAAVRTRPGDTA